TDALFFGFLPIHLFAHRRSLGCTRSFLAAQFAMQVVFLGYGVVAFELELLNGAPQLAPDTGTAEQQQQLSFTPSASAKFDLSSIPAPAPTAPLKSSWASSMESMQAMQEKVGQATAGAAAPAPPEQRPLGSLRDAPASIPSNFPPA